MTLNGTGSYDPLGEALTYAWTQISGPQVALSGANTAIATFTSAADQTYSFRLTVTNTDGLKGTATTTVTTSTANQVRVLQFSANPATVAARPGFHSDMGSGERRHGDHQSATG